jgi:hypothetical protein
MAAPVTFSLRFDARRTRVAAPALTTPGLGRIRRAIFDLLQEVIRPPPPARRHPGNRKQPFDFIAITRVYAKYISDGEIMIGFLDYPDLIAGPHITLDNYSQVRPRSQRLGEAARKRLIVHPNSKPPARDSRLGNFKNKGTDLPTLSDECIVHLNPFCREILAKLTVCKRSANLLFPPPCVLNSVCVDDFVTPPVCPAIRLVVSGKLTPRAAIRPTTGDFQIALLAGRPWYSNSRAVPTLTDRTLPVELVIRSSRSRRASGVSNGRAQTSGHHFQDHFQLDGRTERKACDTNDKA